MKRKLFLVMTAVLAAGLLFTGCPTGDDDDPPDYGTNLVTEAAILGASGLGVDDVSKVAGGYQVTGTVTEYSNWDGSYTDKRIQLNIAADPEEPNTYFAKANRYGITVNFPNSAIKPIPEYTEGFRIYLENINATPDTPAWKGTWQHEWPDEYNAIGGVGTMTINRDLSVDGDGDPLGSEVADYHYLAIVLIFEDADEGEEYTFTISDVAVYGDSIKEWVEFPVIHETSELDPAEYNVGDVAEQLKVVPAYTDNSSTYTYQWYSNTTSSNIGGTEIPNETSATFTPPTDTEGTFYYYCVVSYAAAGTSNKTAFVRIIVGPVTPSEDLWTPDPVAAPSGWTDFPSTDILAATFYPAGGSVVAGTTPGTYKVTAKTRGDGQTEITFAGTDDFAFKDGYYLSVTLPTNPPYRPNRLYTYMSTPANWDSAVDSNDWSIPAGKFIGGKVDLLWEGTAAANTGFKLQIYWENGTPAGQDYVFTINTFQVAEVATPVAETPDIHETSELDDATYAKDATSVAQLKVVPRYTDNSWSYTYQWYSNSTNSTVGGSAIGTATSATFTPPTNVEGIVYYYCVVTYPTASTTGTTRAVKITVTDQPIIQPGDATKVELGAFDHNETNATQRGWVISGQTFDAFVASKYLVLKTVVDDATKDNAWGYGGIGVMFNYDGGGGYKTTTVTDSDWTDWQRVDEDVVYIVIQLDLLDSYTSFIADGLSWRQLLIQYYGKQGGVTTNPESLDTLGVTTAFLVTDFVKPSGATDIVNNDVTYGYITKNLPF